MNARLHLLATVLLVSGLPGALIVAEDPVRAPEDVTVFRQDDPVSSTGIAYQTIPPGNLNGTAQAFHRAGHPESLRRWAVPSDNRRYGSYYVGGGLPVRGTGRFIPQQGTWGWDYLGVIPKRVNLRWGHNPTAVRSEGSYRTEGPRLIHE